MSINEFLDTKKVTIKELDDNFKIDREIEIDVYRHKGCFNCNDTINQENFTHEAWTQVFYCRACKSINLIVFSDRMGGALTDTVFIYKEK